MLQIEEIPAKPKEQKTIRVAAYARVSSDKDAAFHSLEAQTGILPQLCIGTSGLGSGFNLFGQRDFRNHNQASGVSKDAAGLPGWEN